ncbi:MAG: insulinase family protein [Ignavibacteria bacterium]
MTIFNLTLNLFYRLPEAGTKDYYAANILTGILSEGDSSRFYKVLEYDNELVNECDTNLYGMEQTSIFCISALLSGKRSGRIQTKIDEVLDDIKAEIFQIQK